MKTNYMIEIDGGPMNGARRQYKQKGTAYREAKKHFNYCDKIGYTERVYIDIFETTLNGINSTTKLIDTLEW